MINALTRREHIVPKILRLGSSFGQPEILPKQQTVVIDYSSVNIGKPIHAGHLRATLFGHFIRRINEFMGHKVIGINYIGDCGFQLGTLMYGLQRFGDENSLRKDGVQHLYDVYTRTHRIDKDEVHQQIEEVVKGIESGNEKYLQTLKTIKNISLAHLKKTYERMGVDFTEYQFESQFMNDAKSIANKMVKLNLAEEYPDGSVTCEGCEDQPVTLLANEGRSLYLSRDVAAAIQRHRKYNFDRIHYVVSEGQSMHFKNLVHILEKLGYNLKEQCEPWGVHVPFGFIKSMSTREGKVAFLHEILNEFQNKMIKRLSRNTRLKDDVEIAECADKLAWSFLVECLLKFPRMKPIPPSFYNNDDGIRLQYCHTRLCSLENVAAEKQIKPICNDECLQNLMKEHLADDFMLTLLRYPLVVEKSYLSYEPHHLVMYTRNLTVAINRLLKHYKIITNRSHAAAETNLALIMAGRQVLRNSFHLLGMPLVNVV